MWTDSLQLWKSKAIIMHQTSSWAIRPDTRSPLLQPVGPSTPLWKGRQVMSTFILQFPHAQKKEVLNFILHHDTWHQAKVQRSTYWLKRKREHQVHLHKLPTSAPSAHPASTSTTLSLLPQQHGVTVVRRFIYTVSACFVRVIIQAYPRWNISIAHRVCVCVSVCVCACALVCVCVLCGSSGGGRFLLNHDNTKGILRCGEAQLILCATVTHLSLLGERLQQYQLVFIRLIIIIIIIMVIISLVESRRHPWQGRTVSPDLLLSHI